MLRNTNCGSITTLFLLTVALHSSVLAQNLELKPLGQAPRIPERLLHEFNDEDGEVLATGQFVKLEGATVTIRDANHVESTLKMDDLCQEDKRWVNQQIADEKKNQRLAEEAKQVWSTVDKDKPRTVVKACNRLKSFGRAAGQHAPAVRALFGIEDDRAKLACLATYAHICKLELASLKLLVGDVTKNLNGVHDVLAERPGPFLQAIASMDYLGLIYLRHVAYTGELKTEGDWTNEDPEPVSLPFSQGPQNTIRLAAIEALGELRSEESAATLLELAPLVEAPINGKRDDATISAMLRSFGNIGVKDDDILEIIHRYEKDFPKIVSRALEQLGDK